MHDRLTAISGQFGVQNSQIVRPRSANRQDILGEFVSDKLVRKCSQQFCNNVRRKERDLLRAALSQNEVGTKFCLWVPDFSRTDTCTCSVRKMLENVPKSWALICGPKHCHPPHSRRTSHLNCLKKNREISSTSFCRVDSDKSGDPL